MLIASVHLEGGRKNVEQQFYYSMYVCIVIIYYSKSIVQPGKNANPARSQLNLRIWSRETGSAVRFRVSLLISILKLNLVLDYGILPEFHGGVDLFI